LDDCVLEAPPLVLLCVEVHGTSHWGEHHAAQRKHQRKGDAMRGEFHCLINNLSLRLKSSFLKPKLLINDKDHASSVFERELSLFLVKNSGWSVSRQVPRIN
jgi:hypothetical protein